MAVDGYLNFDTKINKKGFEKGLSGLGGSLDGLKSKLKGIAAAAAAAFSVQKIIQFGKSAVEAAAEVNAANSAMTQTFGTLEQAAHDAMQRVADESGIVKTRLQGIGTGIYSFAKTAGMESTKALSMMEDALRVAADSAAYYDRSLEDVSESLKSFLKGNFANDAALGVSCTETTRNIAANKLFSKSYRELSEAQKQLALLQMVKDANALSGAEGQAAREAEGWENVIGNLKETWRQFLATVGQPALHVATAAVKQLTGWLAELTSVAKSASDALSAVMGWENNDTQTAAAAQNISAAVDAQDAMTAAVEETAEAQKDLTSYDELHIIGSQDAAESVQESVSEPVAVTPVIADTDTEKAADALSERIQNLLQPVKVAWELEGGNTIATALDTWEKIRGMIQSVHGAYETVWENGTGTLTLTLILQILQNMIGSIGNLAEGFREAWDNGGKGVRIVQSLWNVFNNILTVIRDIWASVREWTVGLDWNPLLDALAELFDAIDALTDPSGGAAKFLKDVFEDVLLPIGKWFAETGIPKTIRFAAALIRLTKAVTDNLYPVWAWIKDNLLAPGLSMAGTTIGLLIDMLTDLLDICTKLATQDFDFSDSLLVGFGKEIGEQGNFWELWESGAKDMFPDDALTDFQKKLEKLGEKTFDLVDFLHFSDQEFAEFKADVEGKWESLTDSISSKWNEVFTENWASGMGSISQSLSEGWDTVSGAASGWLQDAESVLEDLGGDAYDFFAGVGENISGVGDWISGVGDKIGEFYDMYVDSFETLGGWVYDWWEETKKNASEKWSSMQETLKGGWESVKGKVTDWKSHWGKKLSEIKSDAKKKWEEIKGEFTNSSAWLTITDKVSGFKEAWIGGFQSIVLFVKKAAASISKTVLSIWQGSDGTGGIKGVINKILAGLEGFFNFFVNGINFLIGQLNSISFSTPDWLKGIGKAFSWNIPDQIGINIPSIAAFSLPRLATGTVVPANFGDFAAILGDNKREPEIVSPVSTMKQAFLDALREHGGGQNGGTYTFVTQLVCEGRKLAEVVKKYEIRNGRVTNGG